MKNITKYTIAIVISLLSIYGCKEDQLGSLEHNPNPPGKVSNVKVINGPAKADLTYSLPTDKDLLYIKAVYQLASGRIMEVKSSYYSNTLTVEGFGDTNEHEVKLYAVNRSEVQSEPTLVTVKPLENPIWEIFKSLDILPDFGGIKVTGTNAVRENIALEIYVEEDGKLKSTSKNLYTSAEEINYAVRGLDTLSKKFAITIRDRWLNYSDTIYKTLTPLYETTIPKSGYRGVNLPTDVSLHTSTTLAGMWDGDLNGWPRITMTSSAVLTPQWITVDLGVKATLSRMVLWDYPEYLNGRTYFYGGNLKEFEVWGSDNPPSDGSFNNWFKLGTFTAVKPSGAPYGVNTSEDVAAGAAGLNYTFDLGTPKTRYIRIKSIKNWQGTTFMAIGEIQLYGDPR